MCQISVIIPVYNASRYIDDCLKSVCSQTVCDIEIILINDGSKDDSDNKCRIWQSKDKRIKYYSQNNKGVSSARNFGIEKASSEYITFVDSDDLIRHDYCETLLKSVSADVDMVAMGMSRLLNNQLIPIRYRLDPGCYQLEQLKRIVIDDGTMSGFTFQSACATLYRKSVIQNNGIRFDENIRFNEDGLFNVMYMMSCNNCVVVNYDEVIYYYRVNEISSSNTVNLVSEYFTSTLNSIETILIKIGETYPRYEIEEQVSKRAISTGLSQLRYASKHGCSIKTINSVLNSSKFQEGIKLIDSRNLPVKKKLVLMLLRTKNPYLIRMGLKVT